MSSLLEQLPLVTSFEETLNVWPEMSGTQKLGACAAAIITTSRPILRHLLESRYDEKQEVNPAKELLANITLDLQDKLDGMVARATGGVTALGQEYDPLMDKIDFIVQEFAAARRGTLSLGHVAIRLARDTIVTVLRSHVNAVTHGEANISADRYGKASTLARLVSLRITGLPFEANIPHLRALHQTAATGLVVVSGAKNATRLLDAKAAYIEK